MTVKRKVLVLIFAVILVAAGASTFISRSISINAVEDEIGNLLTTIAQSKSLQIQSSLSEKQDSVKSISDVIATVVSDVTYQDETDGKLDSPFVTYVLQGFKESDESIHEILVWDNHGALVASTRSDGGFESSGSLNEAFSNGKTEAYIGEVVEEKGTGGFVLYTSAPILIGGEMIGVVGLLNGVDDLFQIATDRTGLGETGEAYVVDAKGVLITPSRFVGNAILNNRIDIGDLEIDPLQQNPETMRYAHKAVRAKNYLGGDVFRAYAELPDMGWVVVAEKGSSEAFEPVARMTNTMLLVLLALLGVGAIGAFFVTRTITKPIVNLHYGVAEIMKGNLDHAVGASGNDEIGQLSRAFDEMTANLKKSQNELKEYSQSLEKMVAARTRDLSMTNEELNKEVEVRKKAEETLLRTNAQLRETMDELKSSQAQLLQSEKLAAIGELVSGVAHELNNPLMAISGYVELMQMYVEDQTAREDLQNLKSLSERATAVVRNLLSFARKQDPKRNHISVNEAIKGVVRLRAYELNLDNIEIVQELAPDLPKTMADFQQLQQVFLNLLVNAEQAMRDAHGKGKLIIKTQQVGDMIRTTFTDDGPGIPRDIMNRIFEPFFTTKPVGKGTGLGLSICYGIIQEHHGRIFATSKEGQGTTFTVELPVVAEVGAGTPGERSLAKGN